MMEDLQELIQRGKKCFENRQYASAETLFRKALKTNDSYADLHNLLGIIQHNKGNFETAMTCFKKALTINPNYTEALLNLAVLYNDLGKYQESKELYGKLKKKSASAKASAGRGEIEPVVKGKLSNLHANVGDIYHSVGRYAAAAEEYSKALALNPDYADIRTKLGIALREAGKPKESLEALKQAVKDKPKYIGAWIQLGLTHYSMAKKPEAKEAWGKVLKIDPKNESASGYLKLV